MPLVEFKCECGLVFEEIVSKTDGISTWKCSNCGKTAKKLVSNFAVAFKGAGVHRVEYPNVDQAVGDSAEQRWSNFYEKKAQREKEGRAADKVSHNLVVQMDGKTKQSLPVTEKGFHQIKNEFPAKVEKTFVADKD